MIKELLCKWKGHKQTKPLLIKGFDGVGYYPLLRAYSCERCKKPIRIPGYPAKDFGKEVV